MSEDKVIPTLDEMIFPGAPDKHDNQQGSQTTQSRNMHNSGRKRVVTSHDPVAESSKPKFEAIIRRQVDSILDRHMQAARDEIIRMVMLELRSRVPSSKKQKSVSS